MVETRKYKTGFMPEVGNKIFMGDKMFVQAIGVKLVQEKLSFDYVIVFCKKSFIAKDGKGGWINGKIL